LYTVSTLGKSVETESGFVVAREWECLLSGKGFFETMEIFWN
jgi:hypothetical protein